MPIATIRCRSGCALQPTFAYDSGSGDRTFGFGWTLSLPTIARKTDETTLPEDVVVLGTVVVSPSSRPPLLRRESLLLPPDVTSKGDAPSTDDEYREADDTDSTYPADFRFEVTSIAADNAVLRIRYGVIGKRDQSIQPSPAPPHRTRQSSDIEARNDRKAVNPAWCNGLWAGNSNSVVARVRSSGKLDASKLRENFRIRSYNDGDLPGIFIATDMRDVVASDTVGARLRGRHRARTTLASRCASHLAGRRLRSLPRQWWR